MADNRRIAELEPFLYRLLRMVLNPFFRALWLKRVEGLENVPKEGGVLLVSNHESYLDFLIVPVSGCRLPRYMAGEVFFDMPVIGWAFRKMGFIPVDRSKVANTSAVTSALKFMKRGGVVGIFPEGTRSPDGKLQQALEGVGFLAHMSEVPVVPIAVIGTHEAWGKGEKRPRAHPCLVRFGTPMQFSKADLKRDRGVAHETTRTIMQAVAELAGEQYPW